MIRRGLLVLLCPLAAFLAVALLANQSQIGWRALSPLQAPVAHMSALSIAVIELNCRALRTVLLARAVARPIPFSRGLLAQAVGDGAGLITPARIGGDAAKLVVLQRSGVALTRGGVILIGEALSTSVVLACLALVLILNHGTLAAAGVTLLVYPLSVLTIVTIGLTGASHARRLAWILPIRRSLRRKLLRTLRGIARNARALISIRAGLFAGITLCTLLHIATRALILPVLLDTPITSDPGLRLAGWSLALLYAGALVPAPGAGGSVEVGFALLLRDLMPTTALLPALFWWRIYTCYLGGAIGGFGLLVLQKRARLCPA